VQRARATEPVLDTAVGDADLAIGYGDGYTPPGVLHHDGLAVDALPSTAYEAGSGIGRWPLRHNRRGSIAGAAKTSSSSTPAACSIPGSSHMEQSAASGAGDGTFAPPLTMPEAEMPIRKPPRSMTTPHMGGEAHVVAAGDGTTANPHTRPEDEKPIRKPLRSMTTPHMGGEAPAVDDQQVARSPLSLLGEPSGIN
jgi:hypothetical protein